MKRINRNFCWLFITAVAMSSMIAACGPSPERVAEQEIRSRLGDDAKTVEVTIKGGKATLTGAVALRSTRRIAEQIALTLPGIESIENRISTPERQKFESMYMDAVDATLEGHVEYLLMRRVGLDVVGALDVVAMEGIVSVRGRVADEKFHRRVIEVAGEVEGVRKVIDLVSVGDPTAAAPKL